MSLIKKLPRVRVRKRIGCKTKKFRYLSFDTAHNAAMKYFVRFGGYSFPYHCNQCGKFHLTTKIYTVDKV